MQFVSRYVSHEPDALGLVNYTETEHHVWQLLYTRQTKILSQRACDEFINGLRKLNLNPQRIPQLPDINKNLSAVTNWTVVPVASLISAQEFFRLLANRQFPVATFIRREEELNYVQEPDIFHEVFGHCPMLTHQLYANFLCQYANRVLSFPEAQWPLLQRLFWFTVEFGLIKTSQGLRAYGGGILSSISETPYSIESDAVIRILFDPITAFRMPYRIDKLQPVYFIIDNYAMLYKLAHSDLAKFITRAKELGEFPPLFKIEQNNPNIHILAC